MKIMFYHKIELSKLLRSYQATLSLISLLPDKVVVVVAGIGVVVVGNKSSIMRIV